MSSMLSVIALCMVLSADASVSVSAHLEMDSQPVYKAVIGQQVDLVLTIRWTGTVGAVTVTPVTAPVFTRLRAMNHSVRETASGDGINTRVHTWTLTASEPGMAYVEPMDILYVLSGASRAVVTQRLELDVRPVPVSKKTQWLVAAAVGFILLGAGLGFAARVMVKRRRATVPLSPNDGQRLWQRRCAWRQDVQSNAPEPRHIRMARDIVSDALALLYGVDAPSGLEDPGQAETIRQALSRADQALFSGAAVTGEDIEILGRAMDLVCSNNPAGSGQTEEASE